MLSGRISVASSGAACALALLIAVLLLGWDGLVVAGVAAAVAVVCGIGSRQWLGGVTGDTLGATVQVAEIAVLVAVIGLR